MQARDLSNYAIPDEMLKYDLGVGVIEIFHLKNGKPYLILGEYHNKGALSPTVGARYNKDCTLHENIKMAFARKRLQIMDLSDGEISKNIYFSINEKQNLARLTFLQEIKIDLSEDEFIKKYIEPMQAEALRQRSVSEFFWKLNETHTAKESQFKFKSSAEQSESAKKALQNIKAAKFPVSDTIIEQLSLLQDPVNEWKQKSLPLEFYGKNGGRKYSELTGFYSGLKKYIHPNNS